MKRLAVWTVILSWAISAAEAGTFHLPQKYQEQDQWCWAACSQSILEFYGPVVTQTNIAAYGTGGVNTWNYLWGTGTEGGIYRRGIREILQNFGGLRATGTVGAVSLTVVSNQMAARRPIVVTWSWSSGGGHVVVSRGFTDGSMYLMDPWNGPTVGTYAWVSNGSGHSWDWTLRLTNSPTHPAPLQVAEASAGANGAEMVIRWNGLSNRYYALEFTTDLAASGWATAVSNLPAIWPQNAATVEVGNANAFFRIRWEP